MSTENPYQSPEHPSTPDADRTDNDRLYRKYPTWRFWVLTLTCIPGFVAAIIALYVFYDLSRDELSTRLFGLLFLAFVMAFLASSAVIFLYWRAPAKSQREQPISRNRATFLAALWILAILAAPSATMSFCTPALNIAMRMRSPFLIAGSFSIGVTGGVLASLLARGLWLDAIGRPQKPEDGPPQRPIQRLRARNHNGDT